MCAIEHMKGQMKYLVPCIVLHADYHQVIMKVSGCSKCILPSKFMLLLYQRINVKCVVHNQTVPRVHTARGDLSWLQSHSRLDQSYACFTQLCSSPLALTLNHTSSMKIQGSITYQTSPMLRIGILCK